MARTFPVLLIFSMCVAVFTSQAQNSSVRAVPSATPAAVAAGQAVITLQGFCALDEAPQNAAATPGGDCKTVITREQFEKLIDGLNPGHKPLSPATERSLAQSYVELMLFADAARKDGVEKDPDYEAILRVVRMRAMADLYRRELEAKYRNLEPAEIEAFYQKNYSSYQTLTLRAISIPRNNIAVDDQEAYSKQALQVAEDIRERVVKGEDMAALEKEAYKTLALTAALPNTNAVVKKPSEIVRESEPDVVALGAGGVSKVEVEPANYVIYKLESKQTVALDQVKKEIIAKIVQQKMNARLQQIESAVQTTLNENYFGGPGTPTLESVH